MQLLAFELEVPDPLERHRVVESLRTRTPPLLVLNTCQRLEAYGFSMPEHEALTIKHQYSDAEAFHRLVRIAAGLDSRILGELEILGQVRTAYKQFRDDGGASDTQLDRIFQDVLALAREARRESGIDSNLTSLGALASRELMGRVRAEAPVAVIGSGSLAGSVARYLVKRGNHPVRVSSRCPQNAMQLAMQVGASFSAGLDDLAHLLNDVEGIVTATAAPHAVVYPQHLAGAKRPMTIIDLGVPPDCDAQVPGMDGVTYVPLIEVEERAQLNSEDRIARAKQAGRIVAEGAQTWAERRHRRLARSA